MCKNHLQRMKTFFTPCGSDPEEESYAGKSLGTARGTITANWAQRKASKMGTKNRVEKYRNLQKHPCIPPMEYHLERIEAERYQFQLASFRFVGYPSASRHPLRWSEGSRAFGKGILGIPWGAGLALSHREMLQKGRTTCTGRSGKKRSVRQRLCVPLVECQIERALRICRKHPLVCRSALTHRRI